MAAATLTTHILPGELIEDILARLPVKSLKRFRCVAKFWYSLIQSPEFIAAHYSCSKNKIHTIVKRYTHMEEGKPMVSFISNHTLDVVANFDLPYFDTPPSPIKPALIRIVGCSNGILCLSDNANGILLWNLATREFKSLPICLEQNPVGLWNPFIAIGFGYDSNRDDYKVVRIKIYRNGESNASIGLDNRVALYNLTTNSWRNMDATFKFPRKLTTSLNSHFYSNGFYHLGKVFDNEEPLLSFDFIKEVFVATPSPDVEDKNDERIRVFYHIEMDGSVGGLCFDFRTYRYDVWLLGEIGEKNSWTKLFTIGSMYCMDMPQRVSSNGAFFFTQSGEDGQCLIRHQHPSKQETITLQPLGFELQLAMYVESLVSLKGRDEI